MSTPTTTADPSNTLAVLFADVSGSTRLYEQLGDVLALAAINDCLVLVKNVCAGHHGRIVKTIGDEAMAVFPNADHAAEAAAEIQRRLSKLPPAGTQRLAMRIGFHAGPAIEADGDVFGDSVNVAARMVALANRGQVITSDTTTMTLSPWLRSRVRELDSLTVKGKGSDIGIYELICDAEDEVTTLSTRLAVPPARIRLKHDARTLELGPEAEVVTLGRDPGSDVVIADRLASRAHARIERRRDKFVLIDQSTNGSYVTFEGEAEILVRREMLTLRGSGRISFGHAYSVDPTEVVSFVCGAWGGLAQS